VEQPDTARNQLVIRGRIHLRSDRHLGLAFRPNLSAAAAQMETEG